MLVNPHIQAPENTSSSTLSSKTQLYLLFTHNIQPSTVVKPTESGGNSFPALASIVEKGIPKRKLHVIMDIIQTREKGRKTENNKPSGRPANGWITRDTLGGLYVLNPKPEHEAWAKTIMNTASWPTLWSRDVLLKAGAMEGFVRFPLLRKIAAWVRITTGEYEEVKRLGGFGGRKVTYEEWTRARMGRHVGLNLVEGDAVGMVKEVRSDEEGGREGRKEGRKVGANRQ